MQSIFYELWREAGLLLSHLNENQTDWVLGVDFRKRYSYMASKISFSIIFPQIGKSACFLFYESVRHWLSSSTSCISGILDTMV